jgi:hypothetical protein
MWLTTITYDSIGLRTLDPSVFANMIMSIQDKKTILKSIDNAGHAVPGFDAPSQIDPNVDTVIIKRLWNTESAAREFASFVDAASEFITVTVEEQV